MPSNASAVDAIIKSLTKDYGSGAAFKLNELPNDGIEEWIPTGSSLLNAAIGKPGIPIGRITTINGKPAAGKTTMVTHALAEVQKMGGIGVLIDTERTYAPDRAKRIGVDGAALIMLGPDKDEAGLSVEGVLDRISTMIDKSVEYDVPTLIAWDSIAATPTKDELALDDDATRGQVASHARIIALHFRKIVGKLRKSRAAVLLVNQIKDKLDTHSYGPSSTYIAEKPIRYHSSLILQVVCIGTVKEHGEKAGITSKIKVEKTNFSFPFKVAEVDIMPENGYSESRQLLQLAVKLGLVSSSGAWYTLDDKKFQRKDWDDLLKANPTLNDSLMKGLGSGLGEGVPVEQEKADGGDE
jgi:recombination protein RecA